MTSNDLQPLSAARLRATAAGMIAEARNLLELAATMEAEQQKFPPEIQAAAEFYCLSPATLLGRTRRVPVPSARALAAWLLRHSRQGRKRPSLPAIGRLLHIDHSSVHVALRRLQAEMTARPAFRAKVMELQAKMVTMPLQGSASGREDNTA